MKSKITALLAALAVVLALTFPVTAQAAEPDAPEPAASEPDGPSASEDENSPVWYTAGDGTIWVANLPDGNSNNN